MSEFAQVLEAAMEGPTEPRPAVRRFETSVNAFERVLGGLVPPVGAVRASGSGAAPAQARFASYAARPVAPVATRSWSTANAAPAPAAPRATYA